MTEALIREIQTLIEKLSGEVNNLSEEAATQIESLHVAVNNIASHTLAIEGIVVALARKVDISPEEVSAWIREKTDEFATEEDEGTAAEGIAKELLS